MNIIILAMYYRINRQPGNQAPKRNHHQTHQNPKQWMDYCKWIIIWIQCCWNLRKSTAPSTNISMVLNPMMTRNSRQDKGIEPSTIKNLSQSQNQTTCKTTVSNPWPSIQRKSHLPSNQMGSKTLVRRRELEHLKTPSISFLLAKIPTRFFSIPTATICQRLKEWNLHMNWGPQQAKWI